MIRSMTGFARSETTSPWGRLDCELRSVNHRYLDISLRLPDTLRHLEPELRDALRQRLDRGKVELTLRMERQARHDEAAVDADALQQAVAVVQTVRQALGDAAGPVDPLELSRWPGVLQEPSVDPDALAIEVRQLVDRVLAAFLAHREREGERLHTLVEQRLQEIEAITDAVGQVSGQLVSDLRDKLRERAQALAADLAPERLEQEVALLAQKADVAEELDRLHAHVAETRSTLASNKPVGRRLDFLAQELNREANTLASKANRSDVATQAVDLKVLIEQIREQIQNIE